MSTEAQKRASKKYYESHKEYYKEYQKQRERRILKEYKEMKELLQQKKWNK